MTSVGDEEMEEMEEFRREMGRSPGEKSADVSGASQPWFDVIESGLVRR